MTASPPPYPWRPGKEKNAYDPLCIPAGLVPISGARRTSRCPFFLASTVTVFLHFLIMTMMFNPHVPEIRGGATLAFIFQLGVFVITTFAILFMISIHQMLLKKRKKELGLYTILGMEKKHISLILFWENAIQTTASLALGLILGFVGGQLMWMILLRMLNSPDGLPYTFSLTALTAQPSSFSDYLSSQLRFPCS